MEQLPTPEIKQPTGIKELLRQQLEKAWIEADKELKETTERLETNVLAAAERLEMLDHIVGTPAIVATIDTWDTKYDIWTYSEGPRTPHDYQINTNDLSTVCAALTDVIRQDKYFHTRFRDYDLEVSRIGILSITGEIINLDPETYRVACGYQAFAERLGLTKNNLQT